MRRALIIAVVYAAAGLVADAPVQPAVPYASYTEFDATPPAVTVQRAAWPWPVCDEPGVTVVLRNRVWRDAAAPGEPTVRSVTWLFSDAAGNQTAVIRHERTWVLYGPYGSLDDLLPE